MKLTVERMRCEYQCDTVNLAQRYTTAVKRELLPARTVRMQCPRGMFCLTDFATKPDTLLAIQQARYDIRVKISSLAFFRQVRVHCWRRHHAEQLQIEKNARSTRGPPSLSCSDFTVYVNFAFFYKRDMAVTVLHELCDIHAYKTYVVW